MANFSDFFGGGVKSVQRGVTTPTGGDQTISISAVNPAKTMVNMLESGEDNSGVRRLSLVNSTSLRIICNNTGSTGYPCSWEVIEFY